MVSFKLADALAANRDRGARGAGLSGLLAGLAVLARPAVLLPAILLIPAAGSRRRAAWLAGALVLVLSPWFARNVAVVGAPVLTTNSGVTLVGANSDAAATW